LKCEKKIRTPKVKSINFNDQELHKLRIQGLKYCFTHLFNNELCICICFCSFIYFFNYNWDYILQNWSLIQYKHRPWLFAYEKVCKVKKTLTYKTMLNNQKEFNWKKILMDKIEKKKTLWNEKCTWEWANQHNELLLCFYCYCNIVSYKNIDLLVMGANQILTISLHQALGNNNINFVFCACMVTMMHSLFNSTFQW